MQQTDIGCVIILLFILVGALVANAIRVSSAGQKLCTACGFIGKPKSGNAGNFAVEVLLWLLFIIPGLVYSLWRISNVKRTCPKCGGKELIPPDTPMARQMIATFQAAAAPPQPIRSLAQSAPPATASPGQPGPDQQFCIHCGQSNPPHAAFCNGCGQNPKQ